MTRSESIPAQDHQLAARRLSAGHPADRYLPLLALLLRRLTNDEVNTVAKELIDRGEFDTVDIGVAITQITDESPAPQDVERVRARLAAKGWPLDDPRDSEEDG